MCGFASYRTSLDFQLEKLGNIITISKMHGRTTFKLSTRYKKRL